MVGFVPAVARNRTPHPDESHEEYAGQVKGFMVKDICLVLYQQSPEIGPLIPTCRTMNTPDRLRGYSGLGSLIGFVLAVARNRTPDSDEPHDEYAGQVKGFMVKALWSSVCQRWPEIAPPILTSRTRNTPKRLRVYSAFSLFGRLCTSGRPKSTPTP